MKSHGQRIAYFRDEVLGMNQEQFAEALGVSRGAVGNWERDKPISRKNIEAIATKWSISSDWLLSGRGTPPGQPVPPMDQETLDAINRNMADGAAYAEAKRKDLMRPRPGASRYQDVWLKGIPIHGDVAAGAWIEPAVMIDAEDQIDLLMAAPALQDDIFALRVRGSSVNKIAADGDYVVCLALDEADPNDLVVVERVREQGGLRETTVKRLRTVGNRRLLYPESNDAQWKDPIPYGEDEGEEVRIIGRVLYVIRDLRR